MDLIDELRQFNYVKCDGIIYQMKTKAFASSDNRIKKFITRDIRDRDTDNNQIIISNDISLEITEPNFEIKRLEPIHIEDVELPLLHENNGYIFTSEGETPYSTWSKYDIGKGYYIVQYAGFWLLNDNYEYRVVYIHQLQNTFEDLTGKYLNLKTDGNKLYFKI